MIHSYSQCIFAYLDIRVLNSVFFVDDDDENRTPTTSAHHALALGRVNRIARVRLTAATLYPECWPGSSHLDSSRVHNAPRPACSVRILSWL